MTALKGKCRVTLSHGHNPDIEGGYWENPKDSGQTVSLPVKTLDEARLVCRRYIEENGLGGGNWTGGEIYCNRKLVARVSYNGRVWSPSGARLAGARRRRSRR